MLEVIALLLLASDGSRFFERRDVDFWDSKRKAAEAPTDLWADSTAPPPVRRLLEEPSAGNARAYLAWQDERLKKLRAALAAVESARGTPAPAEPILYFARDGCRWCALQEKELEGLSVLRVPAGSPLWAEHGVSVTPTLVVRGKAFRGLTSRGALMQELRHE